MKAIEKKYSNRGVNLDFEIGKRDVICKSYHRKYAVEYAKNRNNKYRK